MKVAQVAKPNAPLETVARASDVVAVLGNGGLGHLAGPLLVPAPRPSRSR